MTSKNFQMLRSELATVLLSESEESLQYFIALFIIPHKSICEKSIYSTSILGESGTLEEEVNIVPSEFEPNRVLHPCGCHRRTDEEIIL